MMFVTDKEKLKPGLAIFRRGDVKPKSHETMVHANIDVTQNAYGRNWREEKVEAVARTIDAVFPMQSES